MDVILASASPRRKALLGLLWHQFSSLPADIDESVLPQELPQTYVSRVAREKARVCAERTQDHALVLAADTTISLDEHIVGKPVDYDHAKTILRSLSGRKHQVLTAVSARRGELCKDILVASTVTFTTLSDDLIESYLTTDEPWDKAGAYAIQGRAGSFVTRIEGSYSAVVGLPLAETRELLAFFGLAPDWALSIDD